MNRIICLVIGYVFGNFLTAVIVSRAVSGRSIFEQGSGNPGMANVGHLFGTKCAVVVLAGDLIKSFGACLLCRFILFPELGAAAAAYAGLGTVLGHNFPVWHRFRGGKGVVCTCAAVISISFTFGVLACVIGGITDMISHILPVSAVVIPAAFLIPAFLFYGYEIGVITVIMTVIMAVKHFVGYKWKKDET